jgi:flagellar hook-basal body complex protein FliE
MNVAAIGADAYAKSLTAGMLQLNQAGAMAAPAALEKGAQEGGAFQQILGQAIDKTVQAQNSADEEIKKFLVGDGEDLHSVMIAQQKADLAFQMTLSVRNKLVDAYQEIMRMQI